MPFTYTILKMDDEKLPVKLFGKVFYFKEKTITYIIISCNIFIILICAVGLVMLVNAIKNREYCLSYSIHGSKLKQECFKNKTIYEEFYNNMSRKYSHNLEENSSLDSILWFDNSSSVRSSS